MEQYSNQAFAADGYQSTVRLPFITETIALMLIPFEEAFSLQFGSVLRIINILTLLLCVFSIKNCLRIRTCERDPVIPQIVFLVYSALSIIWCFDTSLYIDRLSTYTLWILLSIVLKAAEPTRREMDWLLLGLCIGGVIAAFVSFFSSATQDIGGRMALTIFGRYIDPNILSYSVCVSFIITLFILLYRKNAFFVKLILVVLQLLMLTSLLILGSRGAFVTCSVVSIIMFLRRSQKFGLAGKILIFICVVALVLVVYNYVVLQSQYATRFTFDNLIGQGELGTAQRDVIWEKAFILIRERPILGYGTGSAPYAIGSIYRFYGTHNSYINILLEAGTVGLFIFLVWLKRVFSNCSKEKNDVFVYLLMCMLFMVLFIEGFSTKIFWGLDVILTLSANFKDVVE